MNLNTIQFGDHLIYDAYRCPLEVLNDEKLCKKILVDLCNLAHMHALIEPVIISSEGSSVLAGKDPGGFSGFLIIEESHISIHTFVRRGYVTIDLYSCKEFDAKDVISYLNETLKPKDADVLKMARGLKYPDNNIY